MNHLYDPLTADEIERAVHAVLTSQPGLLSPRFPLIRLDPRARRPCGAARHHHQSGARRSWSPTTVKPVTHSRHVWTWRRTL